MLDSAPPIDQLGAALDWAAHGRRVFPCNPETKAPLAQHGVDDATIDPDTIRQCWTDHPDAWIGMACGAGIAVLDLDIDKTTGEAVGLTTIEKAFPDALKTPLQTKTPSGGIHLWFEDDDRLGNWVKVLPGVDVRTTGGYGRRPTWDYQPFEDASQQYVRAGKWTVEVEGKAHLDAVSR